MIRKFFLGLFLALALVCGAFASHLTPAQAATLKAYILADPVLAPLTSGPGTDYGAIAAALNTDASPAFVVWKTSITEGEILQDAGMDWTRVDNLSVGKSRIWEWMFRNQTINPSQANIRTGIAAVWVGTAADLAVQAAALAKCKRNANRVEKLFATGTGSTASPATMTAEGPVSLSDIAGLFNLAARGN